MVATRQWQVQDRLQTLQSRRLQFPSCKLELGKYTEAPTLTSHWPRLDHMPTPEPITSKEMSFFLNSQKGGICWSRAGWSPRVAGVGRNGDLDQLGLALARKKEVTVQGGVVGQGPGR